MSKFLLLLLSIAVHSGFSQCIEPKCKSLSETAYLTGDRILCPNLVYLEPGSTRIDREKSQFSIKIIGGFLKAHEDMMFEIGIYMDWRGNDEINLEISQNRAADLKALFMTEYSVASHRLIPKGYGEENPLYSEAEILAETDAAEQETMHRCNFRTVLKVL